MWTAQGPTLALSPTFLAQRQFLIACLIKGSLENMTMWQISLSRVP
jgi:hypothetical protein